MKKKILICANADVGLYKFRKELIYELIAKGYRIYVSLPDGDLVKKLVSMGCEFIETPIQRRGKNPVKDISLLVRYLKILKAVNPDVVLTYTIKPNIYAGIACSIKKIPYFVTVTGLGTSIDNGGALQKFVLQLYKLGISKAECVYFQNNSNREFMLDKNIVNGRTCLLGGSGVNLKEYDIIPYPDKIKPIRFLFVGRIKQEKGINELLEAANIVNVKYSEVVVDILGSYDEDYSKQINALEEKGIVCYHGHQKDVRKFLRDCNAVVLPSYTEGMSNALLEAASSARPIIATTIPGCVETFEEGVSGFGVKMKDSKDLAEKMIKFIELPYDKKCDMGMQGRIIMEKLFDRSVIVDKYLQEINKITEAE